MRHYCAVVPFYLQKGDKLKGIEKDGLSFKTPSNHILKISAKGSFYIASINGSGTENEALDHIGLIKKYLWWVSLRSGMKLIIEKGLQEPFYCDAPERVHRNLFGKDGVVNAVLSGLQPFVLLQGSNYSIVHGNNLNIVMGYGHARFENTLSELTSDFLNINVDSKLVLALELHNNLYEETSLTARFLLMNSLLEALLEDHKRPNQICSVIDEIKEYLNGKITEHEGAEEIEEQLQSLSKQIGLLKRQSVRFSLANLTKKCFNLLNRDDYVEYERFAKKAYDIRSKLVHQGHVSDEELRGAAEHLNEITDVILRAMVLHPASFPHATI